jgi:hypothetical protein
MKIVGTPVDDDSQPRAAVALDTRLSPDGLPRNDEANRVREKSDFAKPLNMIAAFKAFSQK